jgi:hypothetical protein
MCPPSRPAPTVGSGVASSLLERLHPFALHGPASPPHSAPPANRDRGRPAPSRLRPPCIRVQVRASNRLSADQARSQRIRTSRMSRRRADVALALPGGPAALPTSARGCPGSAGAPAAVPVRRHGAGFGKALDRKGCGKDNPGSRRIRPLTRWMPACHGQGIDPTGLAAWVASPTGGRDGALLHVRPLPALPARPLADRQCSQAPGRLMDGPEGLVNSPDEAERRRAPWAAQHAGTGILERSGDREPCSSRDSS